MPGVKNVAERGVSAARNVFKYSSGTLRSLMGQFTEGAMILIFATVTAIAFYQQHTNVALSGLAAALAVTAFTENLVIGLSVGLIVFGYDLFLRIREPFANPTEDEEEEPAPEKKKKAPPPDNGDRAEFLELGKKYKIPSEKDDKEFHLDAGSTFLNAYKSLKPDQLASMTKDTQDLMQTQKQLMSTLQTLKPLIMDGKEMMNTFQSYFGTP
jgi:hypothetical protein